MGFHIKTIHQKIETTRLHTLHYSVIVVIIAMSTLSYSIVSHNTLILYDHASMLTLQTSLISRALWLPQGVILGR